MIRLVGPAEDISVKDLNAEELAAALAKANSLWPNAKDAAEGVARMSKALNSHHASFADVAAFLSRADPGAGNEAK